MEYFLKNTILGIIILGSVGSIVAAFILWALHKLFVTFAPKLYKLITSTLVSIAVYIIKPGIESQARLFLDHDQNKTSAYYATQKAQIILYFFMVTWLLIWGLVRVKIDGITPSSYEGIFYLSCIFLLLVKSFRTFLCLLAPLIVDIHDHAFKALDDLDPEVKKKYLAYRKNKSR